MGETIEKRILFQDEKKANRQWASAQRAVDHYNNLLATIGTVHPSLLEYYIPESYFRDDYSQIAVSFQHVLIHLCELTLVSEYNFSESDVTELDQKELFRLLGIGAMPKAPVGNRISDQTVYHLYQNGFASFDMKTKKFSLVEDYKQQCLARNTIEVDDPEDVRAWDQIVAVMKGYLRLKQASFTRGKMNRQIEAADVYFPGLKRDRRTGEFYCDSLEDFHELKMAFVE